MDTSLSTSAPKESTSTPEALPAIERTIHCIANQQGGFLAGLSGGVALWTEDFRKAYTTGLWWLSYYEARNRLQQFKLLQPTGDFGIATLTLQAEPSDPLNWQLRFTSYDMPI